MRRIITGCLHRRILALSSFDDLQVGSFQVSIGFGTDTCFSCDVTFYDLDDLVELFFLRIIAQNLSTAIQQINWISYILIAITGHKASGHATHLQMIYSALTIYSLAPVIKLDCN